MMSFNVTAIFSPADVMFLDTVSLINFIIPEENWFAGHKKTGDRQSEAW